MDFLSIGFDYVNNDKWQMIIKNYWPLLKKFYFYSELWHLNSIDFDEIYPQLFSFKNDFFWIERHIEFIIDFYQDKKDFHLIFYTNPYPNETFSNQYVSIDLFDRNFQIFFKDGEIKLIQYFL